MKKQNYEYKKKIVSRYGKRIWQIDLTFLFVLSIIFDAAMAQFDIILALIFGVIILLVYFLLLLWLIPMYYRSYSCIVEPKALMIRGGVFIYRRTRVRFSAVQYCVISQGYVQKAFQSCSLILMLAGSHVRIRQISLSEAKALKAMIESNKE